MSIMLCTSTQSRVQLLKKNKIVPEPEINHLKT
jgi:hypothetical protein